MRILTIMLAAAVFFLVGMMTGIHVSEQYRERPQDVSLPASYEKEAAVPEAAEGEPDTEEELLERQKLLKETKEINVFSDIGKSLNLFAPSSESSREY
ncbi:hypothetical protein [Salibacterium qingdaonense]|uniref:Uncharacterized protein n=1 Tax=Salibacterium qingdaonense TaxID=266892 RepID=A0A1I4JHC4_9BACI|nr:hypothetical protein [Salibacterium qingdaonense]SFL65914.1 hypothetical protein SAMN04488054_103161 [Salibacterium qingdaonense]